MTNEKQERKNDWKYMFQLGAATLAVMGLFGGTDVIKSHFQRVSNLEQDLNACSNRLAVAKLERDNYRRDLIKYGNPEEWKLNGDALGSCWYERDIGDCLGGYGKEYLEVR